MMEKGESSKRETVGKIATDLARKQEPESPIDVTSELLTDYEKNVLLCVDEYRTVNSAQNFFVVVITKKEPLFHNVLRNYFLARHSCPTPDYDQTVYEYFYKDDSISLLWTIPSKDACLLLLENTSKVAPEEYGLLEYVIKFSEGTLFKLAKELNKEKSLQSPLIGN